MRPQLLSSTAHLRSSTAPARFDLRRGPLGVAASLVAGAMLFCLVNTSTARAESPEGGDFTVGASTNFLRTIAVPSNQSAGQVMMGGMFWRYRFVDWFTIGGSFMFGRDVDDDSSYSISAVRFEILSTQFDIPVTKIVRPYIRIGIGVQSQTIQGLGHAAFATDVATPYHADGLFGLAAPGVAFQLLERLHIYLEFQTSISAGGAPGPEDAAVQLGTELGIGFTF